MQIALSLVVLTGAGLLVRSYQQLQGIDLGFATRNTVTATVSMAERQHWNLKSRTELLRRLEAALSATAGIESVGSGFAVPFAGLSRVQPYSTEQSMEGSDSSQQANQWPVTPGFLEVLGVRLVGGEVLSLGGLASQPQSGGGGRAPGASGMAGPKNHRKTSAGQDVASGRLRIPWRERVG